MEVIQQATSVALVLGLLAAALWWLRRRGFAGASLGRRQSGRSVEELERLVLGPQHVLHLVRVREQAVLLACSAGRCVLIERLPLADGGCDRHPGERP